MYNKIYSFFLMISLFYSACAYSAVPESERDALISLYNHTSGDSWINKTGWLGKVGTECQWYGVSCLRNKHILNLKLVKNRLTGTIPESIELLSHLEILDLSSNHISGSIPKELGNLLQLRTLSLTKNKLSQSIPVELGQLSKMEGLGLDINQLSGVIPKEIGRLSRLKILDLDENKLNGNLPKELGNLSFLQRLSLSNNLFKGTLPNEISLLRKLDSLELFNNCFVEGAFDLLPLQGTVKNLDLGDQNACIEDQSNNIPIVVTSDNYNIYIPSIKVEEESYEVTLARYENPLDVNGWYWNVEKVNFVDKAEKKPNIPPVTYDPITSEVMFHKIHLGRQIINVILYLYKNPLDANQVYFQFTP